MDDTSHNKKSQIPIVYKQFQSLLPDPTKRFPNSGTILVHVMHTRKFPAAHVEHPVELLALHSPSAAAQVPVHDALPG